MQNFNNEKKANNILKEKLNKFEEEFEKRFNTKEVEVMRLKNKLNSQDKDLIDLIMENMKLKVELENKSKICLEDLKSVDISQVIEYNIINTTHSCPDDEMHDNKPINKIFTISTTNLKNANSSKNYQSFSNLEIIDSKKNFLNEFNVKNLNEGKSRNREKSEFLRNRTDIVEGKINLIETYKKSKSKEHSTQGDKLYAYNNFNRPENQIKNDYYTYSGNGNTKNIKEINNSHNQNFCNTTQSPQNENKSIINVCNKSYSNLASYKKNASEISTAKSQTRCNSNPKKDHTNKSNINIQPLLNNFDYNKIRVNTKSSNNKNVDNEEKIQKLKISSTQNYISNPINKNKSMTTSTLTASNQQVNQNIKVKISKERIPPTQESSAIINSSTEFEKYKTSLFEKLGNNINLKKKKFIPPGQQASTYSIGSINNSSTGIIINTPTTNTKLLQDKLGLNKKIFDLANFGTKKK